MPIVAHSPVVMRRTKICSGRTGSAKRRDKSRNFPRSNVADATTSSSLQAMSTKGVWFKKEDHMQLTLAPQEQEVLSRVVESAISDLRTEIGHTDNQAMRQDLQERKGVLLAILERLGVTA